MRKLLVVIALICIGCNVVGFRTHNRQEWDEYHRKHAVWTQHGRMPLLEPKRPEGWVAITKEEKDREQQAILDAAIFNNPVRIQPKDAVE